MSALRNRNNVDIPDEFLMDDDTFLKLLLADKTAVVESSHPLDMKSIFSQTILIKDAVALQLRFDDKCSTPMDSALRLELTDSKPLETLQGSFGGCAIKVPCNEFRFTFPLEQKLEYGFSLCGKGIKLSKNNHRALFKKDKTWQSFLADVEFKNSVNTYEVKVNKCALAGNIFFGVAFSKDVNLGTFCGADDKSVGWIGCASVWHRGRKIIQSFGERIKVGDVVRVTLDIPRRLMMVAVNGVDYGVAYDRLPPSSTLKQHGLVPMWSFYNTGDSVTLTSGSAGSSGIGTFVKRIGGGMTASAERLTPEMRAEAERLANIGYPLDWCVYALEMCDNNTTRAAEYLIEHQEELQSESTQVNAQRAVEEEEQLRSSEDRWLSSIASNLGFTRDGIKRIASGAKESGGAHWGFRFTVTPLYAKETIKHFLANSDVKGRIDSLKKIFENFTLAQDRDVVHIVNALCARSGADPLTMCPEDIQPTTSDMLQFRSLSGVPLSTIQLRYLLIRNFNRRLSHVLPLIDLSCEDGESFLAQSLRGLRFLVLNSVKRKMLDRILEDSHEGDGHSLQKAKDPKVRIDRQKATRLSKLGQVDVKGTRSMFGQMFQQLNGYRLESSATKTAPIMLSSSDSWLMTIADYTEKALMSAASSSCRASFLFLLPHPIAVIMRVSCETDSSLRPLMLHQKSQCLSFWESSWGLQFARRILWIFSLRRQCGSGSALSA